MTRPRKNKEGDLKYQYQYIEKRNIPGWAGPSSSTAPGVTPAPTRPSTHQRIAKPGSTLTQNLEVAVKEPDWEVLSDASGTDENGDKQARAKRDHLARKEREKAWSGDQKRRAAEQAAINRDYAKKEQERVAKTTERKAWAESGGASPEVPRETKPGWFGWVPKMPWNSR